jgi:CBS domain containing-hemolysin-like protein
LLFADVPHWGWVAAGLVAIPILVALNGFFVAAEFALVAVRATRVEELVKQGVNRAKAVQAAIANLDRSIAATQLGITLASIALGWVGERAMEQLLKPVFEFLPERIAFVSRHALSIAVSFSFVTFMHVVFGELIPKAIALQTPDTTALWIAPPLNAFAWITRPVVWVMNGTGNWLIRQIGYKPSGEGGEVHSVEELRMLVEDTQEAGLLEDDTATFVQNVFLLTNKAVKDCMIPREKLDALEVHTPTAKVLSVVRRSGHTRLPVYDGELDNIVGILNTKHLFSLLTLGQVVILEDVLYPATFIEPDVPVAVALRLFKKTRRPMALVRDADKRVVGMLTLEDVLEEIVGDIEDEHDAGGPRGSQPPVPPPPGPKPG